LYGLLPSLRPAVFSEQPEILKAYLVVLPFFGLSYIDVAVSGYFRLLCYITFRLLCQFIFRLLSSAVYRFFSFAMFRFLRCSYERLMPLVASPRYHRTIQGLGKIFGPFSFGAKAIPGSRLKPKGMRFESQFSLDRSFFFTFI
jgi:hypothetical protein